MVTGVRTAADQSSATGPLPAHHMLLTPARLGSVELPNRILMAPMSRMRAADDGTPSEMMADFYAQRATAGLIISEGTFPTALGRAYLNQPGLHTCAHQRGWSGVADKVRAAGGRIFVQLMHAGRISHPDILHGSTPVAPSAVRPQGMVHTATGKRPFVQPRALTIEEVRSIASEFADAARRALAAGADGVELHAANGYLLAQFLSPSTNHRADAYGGSAENRARIVVEVARAIASKIGAVNVGVRLSPGNPENDVRDHDDETYVAVAEQLRALGLAYLHVRATPDQKVLHRLRRRWHDGLVLNQGLTSEPITRKQAAKVLEEGLADAVTIGRAFLANPDLVRRWAAGAELNEIRPAFLYGGGSAGYTDYPVLPPDPT